MQKLKEEKKQVERLEDKPIENKTKSNMFTFGNIILIVFGIIHFLFLRGTNYQPYFSTFLLIIASLVYFDYAKNNGDISSEKGAWAVVIGFIIWFLFLGRNLSGLTFLVIAISVLVIFYGISTKGKGLKEIAIGFVPLIFYFLDLAISVIYTEFFNFVGFVPSSAAAFLQNLSMFIPWWTFFGFLTLRSNSKFMKVAKGCFIIYVALVFAAPLVDFGYQSLFPSVQELTQAEKGILEQLPKKENPAYSNAVCIFNEPTNVQGCVKKRQEESELKYICNNDERVKNKVMTLSECIEEEKKKKAEEKINSRGAVNEFDKRPMKAEFVVNSKTFPSTVYRKENEALDMQFPIKLEIENPREYHFMVDFSCNFVQGKGTVNGKIITDNPVEVNKDKQPISVECEPIVKNLTGKYKVVYNATLRNIVTKSTLRRAFIGTKSESWRNEWDSKIYETYFKGDSHLSQAPMDFARINFDVGNQIEEPIIQSDKKIRIWSSTAENLGKGKILNIHRFSIDLLGSSVDDNACLGGYGVAVPEVRGYSKQNVYFPRCYIETLSPNLEDPEAYNGEDFIIESFTAELEYDYLISKEVSVSVEVQQ